VGYLIVIDFLADVFFSQMFFFSLSAQRAKGARLGVDGVEVGYAEPDGAGRGFVWM